MKLLSNLKNHEFVHHHALPPCVEGIKKRIHSAYLLVGFSNASGSPLAPVLVTTIALTLTPSHALSYPIISQCKIA